MRRDLPLGILAANLLHAGGESSPGNLHEGTYAVVLSVPNEAELRTLSLRLAAAGIEHARIVESDAPYAGQLMALGLAPVADRKGVRRFTSMLPLLR